MEKKRSFIELTPGVHDVGKGEERELKSKYRQNQILVPIFSSLLANTRGLVSTILSITPSGLGS
jgi:hypothetical protein